MNCLFIPQNNKLGPESFALICWLVLMENGQGLINKSPNYIKEKTRMWRAGYNAFGYLDIHNMRKVVEWHKAWKLELPEVIEKEIELQEKAAKEFGI